MKVKTDKILLISLHPQSIYKKLFKIPNKIFLQYQNFPEKNLYPNLPDDSRNHATVIHSELLQIIAYSSPREKKNCRLNRKKA